MAGIASEESGVGRPVEGISIGQHCQSGEALVEWRSSEQLDNGTPSTPPPYWDTDDDNDGWPKPSELYGKYTWKIEKFSQISKRELRSNAFEVGGYKWYILIYPQGCDVCNHLSLFLCVANHDKLLPGWSHFAQFTIAVVNRDTKKSKYSDTLHRFWKKEHDWGWKKFMELSKVSDGFKDGDTLIIKAQVQVIREKTDRPFRCLDCQYRRELVRVYLTNVEQICRRFVEERRGKLGRLIEDKARWSSFCAFWLGIDQNDRCHMSREKTDAILKVVVKHFFIEKEVTSTLVMDSLYSGLKALEGQSKSKKERAKLLDAEDMPAPIVHVEDDMFVLEDDVLLLLERAALEPLPPKDEKGPQNRTKDGNSGEDCNKDSIERDERRLTELGRRTVEIFVLAHIFSNKIEVAYQEAVALKRQEELIREEEAASLAESEQKAKRGATEKEKKLKKKQAKQKRNNRKEKEKKREERSNVALSDRLEDENVSDENEKKECIDKDDQPVPEKPDILEDVSDVSDSVDGVAEVLQPDSEDRDTSPVNWDTDASEAIPLTETSSSGVCSLSSVPNGMTDKRSPSVMDDSSSTCSTDSVPSVVMNGPYKWNSTNYQNKMSPSRGNNQRAKAAYSGSVWATETDDQPSRPVTDAGEHSGVTESSKAGESESEAVSSLQDQEKLLEQNVVKEEVSSAQQKQSMKGPVDTERPTAVPFSPRSSPSHLQSTVQLKSVPKSFATADHVPRMDRSPNEQQHTDPVAALCTSSPAAGACKSEIHKAAASKQTEKLMEPLVPKVSRPSSAPLVPGPRPTAPVVSMVHTTPLLARSVSAVGRLGPDLSPSTHSYVPQSYRNAQMGNPVGSSSSGVTYHDSSSLGINPSPAYSQQQALVSAPMFLAPSSERIDQNSVQSAFPFGVVTQDGVQSRHQWMQSSQRDTSRIMHCDPSSKASDIENLDIYQPVSSGFREHFSNEFPVCASGRQPQGVLVDEFPHLDIINDLLDDEHGIGMAAGASTVLQSHGNVPHMLNRQFSFHCDVSMSSDMGSSAGSCRFDPTGSYHGDGFQPGYSSSGGHFDSVREFVPQATALSYSNGQIDGMVPTMWTMAGSDLSLLGIRNAEGEGYPYFHPEYSNLACGANGYAVFRPSNGH